MVRKLEQFDNWLNEIKQPKWNHQEVCIAEDAWKAALECIRDTIIYESDGPSNPVDLMEWLFKELGDE